MNKKIYLILAVLTIISVLFCLNACSAVEDNNNVSIVSDSIDISADSDLNTQVSSDSVKISQDEVNKELDIKPKYKVKTYSAVVDCPQIKTVKKLKKIIKSEIKDGYGNWKNYKIRNGIYGYANVKVPYKKVPVYKDIIKSKKVKFKAWRYKITIKVYNER